ncbi:MAG: pilus assembly protein [Endomicrobiales bacterium]|nr:pilus assembly protein [Endomicrobiales bacterium]
MNNKFKSNHGQALIETVIVLPVLLMIIIAIVWFSRIVLTKQQLLSAARYGTDLIVYTDFNENQIKQEIRNYLTHRLNQGRKLDPEKLTNEDIVVVIRKFHFPEFLKLENILDITDMLSDMKNFINGLLLPWNDTSYVEIRYGFEIPRALSFLSSDDKFYVSARSEVLAGTGCER